MDYIKNPTIGFRLTREPLTAELHIEGEDGNGKIVFVYDDEDNMFSNAYSIEKIGEILFYAAEFGLDEAVDKYGLHFDTLASGSSDEMWAQFHKAGDDG